MKVVVNSREYDAATVSEAIANFIRDTKKDCPRIRSVAVDGTAVDADEAVLEYFADCLDSAIPDSGASA